MMDDLAVGPPTLCDHFVRGFVASANIDAISCVGWVGSNQPLLMPLRVLSSNRT
jgi:hypothetical protein